MVIFKEGDLGAERDYRAIAAPVPHPDSTASCWTLLGQVKRQTQDARKFFCRKSWTEGAMLI